MGKYTEWDKADLDITITVDCTMYRALAANNHGHNASIALDSLNKKKDNLTWSENRKDKS